VVNAYSSKTGGWPKNDFAGRSFGNAQFHQVYLTE
jgi:peptide/nickel transport system substrate-binding protein